MNRARSGREYAETVSFPFKLSPSIHDSLLSAISV